MYTYRLGGKDNYPSDRQTAERVLQAFPPLPEIMRANRAFLVRAVRSSPAADPPRDGGFLDGWELHEPGIVGGDEGDPRIARWLAAYLPTPSSFEI